MIRLALAFALLAGAAAAQEIAVQAGEHAGFTRLSLRIGAGADWRFGRTATGYGLRLGAGRDFDLGGIFDVIPRDRVQAVTARPGALDLAVGCLCHAELFIHARDWLVIDIADGAAAATDRFDAMLDPPVATPALPLFAADPAPLLLLPGPFARPAPQPGPRAVAMGREMAEAIAQAAGRGLVDLAVTAPAANPEPVPDIVAPPLVRFVPDAVPGQPGIATHSAADRPEDGAPPGGACPDPADFDVALWAGTGDFATELAQGWAGLTDARDRILPDAAETLARRYIAFGFGREALQVLALDPQASVSRDRLVLLAHLVDGRPVAPESFARAAECPGPLALWQALATGTVAPLTETGRTAAVTALGLLPGALRAQLTPRLAAAFAAAGDGLAADALLGQRRPGGDMPARDMAQAAVETALAGDDAAAALDQLDAMARNDPRMTPADLVALVDLALAAGRPPDAGLRALLRSARFEYRDQPQAADLRIAESRVLAAEGEYGAALALLAALPDTMRAAAQESLLIALSAEGDSVLFLETVFAGDLRDATPAAVNALAARLIGEGFPEIAQGLLAPAATGPEMGERRYLRALAAAALGRDDLVEAELLGLTDARAAAIRAGPAALAAESAWRRGDWAGLAGSADPLLSAAAAARLTEAPALTEDPPLAARTALLAEAEAARQLARDLLTRFTPP